MPQASDSRVIMFSPLEVTLENIVSAGIGLAKYQDKDILDKAIERKAVPVVERIINTLQPGVRRGFEGIGAKEIWQCYWQLRQESPSEMFLFVEFLIELKRERIYSCLTSSPHYKTP